MLPIGKITIVNKSGEHRTFRIKKQLPDAKFAPGSTIISLLTGSDNESNYTGFGFVNADSIKVWRTKSDSIFDWYAELITAMFSRVLAGNKDAEKLAEYSVLISKSCIICNRTLTTPESIERGIGPECAERYPQYVNV